MDDCRNYARGWNHHFVARAVYVHVDVLRKVSHTQKTRAADNLRARSSIFEIFNSTVHPCERATKADVDKVSNGIFWHPSCLASIMFVSHIDVANLWYKSDAFIVGR